MRAKIMALGLCIAMSAAVLSAQEDEKERKILSPVEVTRSFIKAVAEKDKAVVKQTFDFLYAQKDLSDKFMAMGIQMPWTLEQTEETLLYYFFEPEKRARAKELTKADVEFEQRINDELKVALVIITEHKSSEKANVVHKIHIGLRFRDGRWQIIHFPDFYPLDAFEVLTGVKEM